MKITKFTALMMAFGMIATLGLSACGSTAEPEQTTTEAATTEAKLPDETVFTMPTYPAPTESVDLSKGVTEAMMERAIFNEGDLSRLGAAMKKAEQGEKVTIGFIGGSITQGSSSSGSENCYAYKTYAWWAEKFSDAEVEYANAGIGATDSYLGVHRVEGDLLSKNPDVVVIEFSVNDTNHMLNQESYESLIRKIYNSESQPAVVLLCTTMEDGTSFQEKHAQVGMYYNLPIISYHDVVYPEVKAGTLIWSDISPDNIHPNDAGHDIIGQMMGNYFDDVYSKLDSIDTTKTNLEKDPLTKDRYAKANQYDNTNFTPTNVGNYTEGTSFARYPNGWKTLDGAESFVFEVEARNIGIIFYRSVSGMYGKYEVYVDGERKTTLDGDFTGGWGSYSETKEVFRATDGKTEKHTVEIKRIGDTESGFEVLGLLLS